MSDEKAQKVFNLMVSPAATAGERQSALDKLIPLCNGRSPTLRFVEDTYIDDLRKKELVEMRRTASEAQGLIHEARALLNAAVIAGVNREQVNMSPNSGNVGKTKNWMIEQLRLAGSKGLTREEMKALDPANTASITKRWSELMNESRAFPIGGARLVHISFREDYPLEYCEWQFEQMDKKNG